MNRHKQRSVALLLIGLTVLTGCHPVQPFYFQEDGDLSHYLDKATQIEYPDVKTQSLPDTTQSEQPLTISNPEFREIWDLHLEECITIALQNSKTFRSGYALAPTQAGQPTTLVQDTTSRAFHGDVYAPAITETNGSNKRPATVGSDNSAGPPAAGFVGGVEAALGEFDASFNIDGQMNKPDRLTNSTYTGSSYDTAQSDYLRTALAKKTATGALFTVANQTNYEQLNKNYTSTTWHLPSYWTTAMEVRVDQPLLRGRGVEINRIPIILARINMDISLADFESALQNTILDVENTYWDLHRAYRSLEAAKTARDSVQLTWRYVYDRTPGKASTQEEAQAREAYFRGRAAVEQSLKEVYDTEGKLRYLLGVAATDGRLIRPIDEPTIARVEFDWTAARTEALVRWPEIRKRKWQVKQRELELLAAKNYLLPKLDVGAVYKWVGVGDDLINSGRSAARFPTPGSTAFQELTSGDYQEFALIFSFQMPVGFRRELTEVRHRQLMLAREKALLEDTELVVVHGLSNDFRMVDSSYVLAQSHFNRWNAAEKEVQSLTTMKEFGVATTDLVLQAQQRRAEAQDQYYRALADYQKAIAKVHYSKGSLPEYNNIQLAEGPWPQKAYFDALGRARERDASYYIDYGFTRPSVVSRGPVPQGGLTGVVSDGVPVEALPAPQDTSAPAAPSAPSVLKPAPGKAAPEGAVPDKTTPDKTPAPQTRPGPITGPQGPVLTAPGVRTAAAGAPGDVPVNPLRRTFEWGAMGSGNQGQAAASGSNPVQQATYVGDKP